ncbi:MAG: nitrous oxide reductase family maturation protein NosD [Dehalococcoidia bacterium]|nr:MAG: nitrous oxide reductase family maturation protein NosD [Dehalococcoidia bacterium]
MNRPLPIRIRAGGLVATAIVALLASVLIALPADAEAAPDSITALIARARPGDTIMVPPGTYREQILVDKPVSLVGEGRPVIDGGRQGDVVLVTADDVTVSGFTIQGSGRDVVTEPAGVRILGDRATIEANRVRDTLYGIVMEDSEGHRILRNEVSSIPEFGSERRGHALYVWHTNGTTIEGNTVTGAKDGIFLGFANHNRVEGNRVTDARYGIHYMYADHNTFIDNVFRESVAGGAIMFSRDITFRGNEFAYNRSAASGYGLLFKDVDDVVMTDNLVHHNRLGITLEGAPHAPDATVILTHNLIGFNDTALELASTTRVTFTGNTFVGNLEQVATTGGSVEHRNTWALGGRGNYWDDYQGYDADGDGVGDIPFHYDGAFDDLAQRNEWVRAYSFTPARMALDLAARWFPAFRPAPSVIDPHPLIQPSLRLEAPGSGTPRAANLAGALLLVGFPLAAWWRLAGTRTARW